MEKLEEIHSEVQEMNTSLHISTTLLYNVSRRWLLYLNRCVTASSSEAVGATGSTVPFLVEPILLKLEGGRYMGPLLPATLAELVSGMHGVYGRGGGDGNSSVSGGDVNGVGSGGGGSRGGESSCGRRNIGRGGGAVQGGTSVGTGGSRGATRVRVHYKAHLPTISLWDVKNSRTIMAGKVLHTVQGHVLCNNWHLCRLC